MPLLNSPNHFLASLSAQDSELLRPHLKAKQLPQGQVLYSAEEAIEQVYFPHTGLSHSCWCHQRAIHRSGHDRPQ